MSATTTLSDAKRKLLEKLSKGIGSQSRVQAEQIAKRPSGVPTSLASSQEQVLNREDSVPQIPPLYNESVTIYRYGPLDIVALEKSFTEVIRRHEIWRSTYDFVDGARAHIVHPAPERIPLPLVDLRSLPKAERLAEMTRRVTEMARQPFDMKQGPLVRAILVRLEELEHRLCLIVHQSILDGISVYHVLLSELASLYEAFAAQKPSPLPELPIQFGDYAYWQRDWLATGVLEQQAAFWKKALREQVPPLAWPNRNPRPPMQSFRGAIEPFNCSEEFTRPVRSLSQQMGSTLFVTLLTAFLVLLHGYTRQTHITIGTVSPAGRKRSETQKLMGYFLNPVPLRLYLTGEETFFSLVQRTQEVISAAIGHDDIPFEFIVRELQPEPDPSRNPFFTVAASLEPPLADVGPQWSLTPMDVECGGARWDVYFVWDDRPTGMIGRVQYNPDLFERSEIVSMVRDFMGLLERIIRDTNQKISEYVRRP